MLGDVLSYYIDNQFKESLLAYAEETKNVYQIAQSMGYKPRTISPASADVDIFQGRFILLVVHKQQDLI